jgi:hypothetical protein
MLPLMKKTKFAVMIGAVLFVGAILAITQTAQFSAGQMMNQSNNTNANNTGTKFTRSLTTPPSQPANVTKGGISAFEIGPQGFARARNITGIGVPIDTSKLKMHIDEAKNALNKNDTNGSLTHLIAALDVINNILNGNATTMTTQNATSAQGSMSSQSSPSSNMTSSTPMQR